LCNKFSFVAVRQKGSHVVLKKQTPEGRVGTVVPIHDQLKIGTLKSILRLARINEEEFAKYI